MNEVGGQHVYAASISDVAGMLSATLDSSLRASVELLEALPPTRLFVVRYSFGQSIAAPRRPGDRLSSLLYPCLGKERVCSSCREFLTSVGGHRALGLVLEGAVEESIEIVQGAYGSEDICRQIPLRVVERGSLIHLTETANTLLTPNYGQRGRKTFEKPIRRTIAGARNVFLTAPLGDVSLVKHLKGIVGVSGWLRSIASSSDGKGEIVSKGLDSYHAELVEALARKVRGTWKATVAFFPIKSILEAISREPGRWERWRAAVIEQAWNSHRGSHSEQIRRAALEELLRSVPDSHVKDLAQHVLNACRGEAIGYRPLARQDNIGPFREIREYMAEHDFKRHGLKWFPAILRPATLQPGQAIYCSVAEPLTIASFRSKLSGVATLAEVDRCLRMVKQANPSLLNGARWTSFCGSDASAPNTGVTPFRSEYDLAHEIAHDFNDELSLASKMWGVKHPVQMLPGGKKGLMSRFVRLSI